MAKTTFGAQLLTLPQIFEQHLFTVPDCQRAYSWDDHQVDELLTDLDHLMDGGAAHRHYTGTLVLSRTRSNAQADFHVVDGQQRLTTLVIALRLLADELPTAARAAFIKRYVRRGPAGSERAVLRRFCRYKGFPGCQAKLILE